MFKRGFFNSKGTSSIRNPIPEAGRTPTGVNDSIIYSIEPCPSDGPFVFKACTVPATFDRSAPASGKSICTRIPPSPIDSYGTCESFLATETKRRLLDTPKFPCSPPDTPASKVYELRPGESNMGRGMFATRSLKIGDLILVERPMLIFCNNPVDDCILTWVDPSKPSNPEDIAEKKKSLGVFQAILEVLFNRMSKADQEAYLSLPNAHKDGPTLTGIWRTNNARMPDLNLANETYGYNMMLRERSRINHNCQQNCNTSFDPASFAIQLRATRPIRLGEEIFMSYCDPNLPTPQRSAWLADMGITCTCPSCVYNPMIPRNDKIRSSIPQRVKALYDLRSTSPLSPTEFYTALLSGRIAEMPQQVKDLHSHALKMRAMACKIMDDMQSEGLDGITYYLEAMDVLCCSTMELSSTSKLDVTLAGPSYWAQWDAEAAALRAETEALHKAHKGSIKKYDLNS